MKSVLKKNLDNYPWIKKKKNALLPIILLRLDDSLGKKVRFEGSVGKMAVKTSLLKGNETSWDVAALWKILAHENGQQWKGGIQLTSFFSSEAKVVLNVTPFWEEIAIQDNEKLIYNEKQRGLLCLPAVDYQSSCIWLLLPLVLPLHAIKWL